LKNLDWVKELVESERRMEETGIIDLAAIPDESRDFQQKTNEFLKILKEEFLEYTTAFNTMKNSTVGSIKIYGISNTVADFMLFRNGFKLLFSGAEAGKVMISFQSQSTSIFSNPGQNFDANSDEVLIAHYGPFGEMTWTYKGTQVKSEPLVRYYLSRFIKESAK
jgi:hypothetical protein